ncbi:MAG TPA: hypothetical protein VHK63_07815 [Candidatus Limnocylindria bacterium]|nr:hypothetical protein [Candidatus Limnocylindria bacterium]
MSAVISGGADAPVPVDERRRRRRRRLLILFMIGVSALPSVTTSYISISLFTEHALLESDAWAPTPVDVQAEPAMLMRVDGMLPGDEHHGQLTVANGGPDALRYALTSTSDDSDGRGLSAALRASVRAEGTSCEAFDGALLYDGPLVGAGFGDPVAGAQAGDRLLPGGHQETICVRVVLPLEAGNRYQRSRTSTTFGVLAEHAVAAP